MFFTYSLIILGAFFIIAISFVIIELPKQKEQVFSSLKQNCGNITASMDREFDQMHTFALNIAYSTLVRDRLVYYMSPNSSIYSKEMDAKILEDLLSALICPNYPADQIYIYTLQDEIVASGLYNSIFNGVATKEPWYNVVLKDFNHKAMMYTGTDERLSKYSTNPYGKHFISLALQIFDKFNGPQGFVEIKKSLSKIISVAIKYESVFGEQIYIFDGSGMLIYPQGEAAPDELYKIIKAQEFPTEVSKSFSPAVQDYYVCAPSTKSDFCTVAVISESALLSPVYANTLRIAIVTIIAFLLALVFAFFAAQRLTTPIDKICAEVVDFDLSKTDPPSKLDIKIVELETLYQSFVHMRNKLTESINKQILLQNQEVQSRILALQAQMNPHFLYNSLYTIQAMADEGMKDDIVAMCQSMANVLRYISSDTDQKVPLEKEIKYTKDFLTCMDLRYQGDLSYSIDIPCEMNDIKVPKLCVQLLVENAVKFSSVNRPPYHISITGEKSDEYYTLSIADNGPGFSEKELQNLAKKIAEIDVSGLLPSLEISGMGLLNVYIRYKLLHRGDIIFKLENHLPHGARVTIGERYEKL